MRYAVTIEIAPETGARLDAQPGGPGPAIQALLERFRPESCHVALDRRALFLLVELPAERDIAALMAFVSARFETYPRMTPVVEVGEFAAISRHIAETAYAPARG